MTPRIPIPRKKLEAFCARWRVEELALFGSVLREDFGADSDVDPGGGPLPGLPAGAVGDSDHPMPRRSEDTAVQPERLVTVIEEESARSCRVVPQERPKVASVIVGDASRSLYFDR